MESRRLTYIEKINNENSMKGCCRLYRIKQGWIILFPDFSLVCILNPWLEPEDSGSPVQPLRSSEAGKDKRQTGACYRLYCILGTLCYVTWIKSVPLLNAIEKCWITGFNKRTEERLRVKHFLFCLHTCLAEYKRGKMYTNTNLKLQGKFYIRIWIESLHAKSWGLQVISLWYRHRLL